MPLMTTRTRTTATALTAAVVGLGAMGGAVGVGPATARPTCNDLDIYCPPPASPPKSHPGTVNVNAGYTLAVRKRPTSASAKVRSLRDGAKVRIVCQTIGQKTTGTYGTSRLWNKLAKGGYVSDTYVYTGSDGRVARTC
jgi:hypothetical protein